MTNNDHVKGQRPTGRCPSEQRERLGRIVRLEPTMSPLEIEILLRYHATIEDYPGAENLDHAPPAVADAIRSFLDQGLIERNPTISKNLLPGYGQPDYRVQIYQATERCHRYCDALCEVPLPI